MSEPAANRIPIKSGWSRIGRFVGAAALAAIMAGCVTSGTGRDGNAPVPSWRSIATQQAWLRVDGMIAASQRLMPDGDEQRIVLENDTLVPAENRIDLRASQRRGIARTVVEIEQVADRAASFFGPIRSDRLEQEATSFGPLFYVQAAPMGGTTCVFAFQRLSPGAGTLPSRARPIIMTGQNCVPGTDARAALDPFIDPSIRPGAIVLDTAS